MSWKQRAEIFLTEKGGGLLPPKPPKDLYGVCVVHGGGPSGIEKTTNQSKSRYAYQFVLRGGEGGGFYFTDTPNLEQARNGLLERYGERLLATSKVE